MSKLNALATRAFHMAWLACGKPTLTVVRPISAWSLPTGYAFDASVDRVVVTATGVVVDDPSHYWATDTVNMIPGGPPSGAIQLMVAGTVPTGELDVCVPGADESKLRAAHAVQFAGAWYNVTNVSGGPTDVNPGWAMVHLQRRS